MIPLTCLWLLFWTVRCAALDLFSPNHYKHGDKVELLLNKVESDHTQLPYRYHDLNFVCHDTNKKAKAMSLGSILRGDRFWESNYDLRFGVDSPCIRLCDMLATQSSLKRAELLIRNGYVVHWSLDGLPGATTYTSSNKASKYYAAGFPLGFVKKDAAFLHNHVMLVVRYHTVLPGTYNIVGFEVYPQSVSDNTCPGSSRNYKNFAVSNTAKTAPAPGEKKLIPYTYSVFWREDNSVTYDTRWDLYHENDTSAASTHIHWLSLINSIVLVCFVSMIVATVMFRLFKSDLLTSHHPIPYSKSDLDGTDPSSGYWKTLVGEVMQKPPRALLLATLTACGVQCLVAVVGVVVICVLNSKFTFGSPSTFAFFSNHEGAFFTSSVIFILGLGSISAYFSIILFKLLLNESPNTRYDNRKTAVYSSIFAGTFPLVILVSIFLINFIVWAKESSNALPFGTIVVLIVLYTIIELPLGYLGGKMGNRFTFSHDSFVMASYVPSSHERKHHPRSKRLSLFINPVVSTALFGAIPFLIVYVDLLLIFNSVWLEKTTFFYMYGFLLLTTLLLVIVVAESAIVATYLSLAFYHNPDWHWLSFRVGTSIGWYVYGYSAYYFVFHLHMSDFGSMVIYFAYMAIVSLALGLACGAVAVITSLFLIRKIYGIVRAD